MLRTWGAQNLPQELDQFQVMNHQIRLGDAARIVQDVTSRLSLDKSQIDILSALSKMNEETVRFLTTEIKPQDDLYSLLDLVEDHCDKARIQCAHSST